LSNSCPLNKSHPAKIVYDIDFLFFGNRWCRLTALQYRIYYTYVLRFGAIIRTVKGFWTFVPTTLRHQPPPWPEWIAAYSKCSHSFFHRDGFNKTCRHGTQQPSGGCIRFGAWQETTVVHPRKGYTNNAGRLSSRRYIICSRWRRWWQCIRIIMYVYIVYTIMGDNTLFRHSKDIHDAFELTAKRSEHATRRSLIRCA